jgi:hypothetical protein
MPIALAEHIYSLIGICVIAIPFIIMFWMHRSFHGAALIERPEAMSEGQLLRVVSWGKFIYRANADSPKGDEIMRRTRLALAELQRRRD